jgi:phosphohistidine phosphatase
LKYLILMRHAKALKESADGSDFSRDLDERGKKDAVVMALALTKTNFQPELIVSSPAKRTKKTSKIMAKELQMNESQIAFDSNIYEAGINDLMHVIHELDEMNSTIMLVGHNPSITSIVGYLTSTFAEHVPTSGIVVVGFQENNWRLVQARTGRVIAYLNPKGLPIN